MMKKNSVELLEQYQIASGYIETDWEFIEKQAVEIFAQIAEGHSEEELDSLVKTAISELREYSKILPTKYQDVNAYSILDGLFKKIERVAKKLNDKNWIIPEKVTYGTVRLDRFSASVTVSDFEGDYLILVSSCTFMFANLLAKSIGMLILSGGRKDGERISFNISKDNISHTVKNNPDAIIRFTDLILAYIVTGQAANAQQYTPNMELASAFEFIREGFELFIVGHEYAHILLGHVDEDKGEEKSYEEASVADAKIKVVLKNWADEHAADLLSSVLTINAMDRFDFCTSYMGVDICLTAMVMLDRIYELLYGKNNNNLSHPPSDIRRNLIFSLLAEQNEDIKNIYDANTYITELLWSRCMYLVEKINKLIKKTFNKTITEVNYHVIQNVLYTIGKKILEEYQDSGV